MSTRQRRPRYRLVDAALIRASAHSGTLAPQPWPEMADDREAEPWCSWLAEVWAQVPVAEAVTLASPALADRIEAVCRGQQPRPGQVRRMALALARYLVRMRGRATPFGVLAGVAPLYFGPQASARWTDDHQRRTRTDAVWLAAVIARLESTPALRQRLPIVVNDLAYVRGDRLVMPWQPHAADPGRGSTAQVSVRYGQAVQTVMQAARSPIRVGDLVGKLSADIPSASVPAVEAMLAELVAHGVLVTSLRPPSTSTDGLAHVLDRLGEAEADTLLDAAPLVEELREIWDRLQAADRGAGRPRRHARRMVGELMRAVSDAAPQPLTVDLRVGCTVVLPAAVAAEAESAAAVLARLAPSPAEHSGWREYHHRFVAQYGGALVPVLQLVDPTGGLGFPAHYDGEPGRPVAAAPLTPRDQRLLTLAQQTALDGVSEVVLDDAAVDGLAGEEMSQARSAAHVGVCAEVRAADVAALAGGEFTLAVTGVTRSAVALAGRFLDLLAGDDRQRMVNAYAQLPVGVEGALTVQVSFPPRRPRTENVARAPRVLPEMIFLAEHHDGGPGRIPLDDLAVTADNGRLYVVSLSRRRVVEPMATNAAAWHTMPPIARLLLEIPHARTAAVSPFDWGAATCLPFLPRVRYGRTVLAPARWRIPAGALPGPQVSGQEWAAGMAALRDRLRLPAAVQVGGADRLLRLNLGEPMDLAVLRAYLDEATTVATVAEAATAADHGWFGGRAHEIVIPVASTTPPARAPAVVTRPGPLPVVGREHGILPGSRVLSVKLYGHADGFNTILTGHLPALLSACQEPPKWWFIRHRDPGPHLRLRLHLADADAYGRAVVDVGAWADGLRRHGLIGDLAVGTYRPETERYGSGLVLAAAETVFATDSAAVLTQLAASARSRQVHPHALTAASLVDLAAALTGGREAGMRWLIDHPPQGPAAASDREVLRQTTCLTAGHDALQAVAGGPAITAAWQERRSAAATYIACLAADAGQVTAESVMVPLLHLHHVRAHGVNTCSELVCYRLARAAALAWNARHTATKADRP